MSGSQMVSGVVGARDIIADLDRLHEPPPGCVLRNDEEQKFWKSLMQGKQFKDWNVTALSTAFKVLKLEFLIRAGRARLDEIVDAGANPFDSDSIAHDWLANITKSERVQLTMIRSLGLTYTPIQSDKATASRAQTEIVDALNSVGTKNGLPGFIATN